MEQMTPVEMLELMMENQRRSADLISTLLQKIKALEERVSDMEANTVEWSASSDDLED